LAPICFADHVAHAFAAKAGDFFALRQVHAGCIEIGRDVVDRPDALEVNERASAVDKVTRRNNFAVWEVSLASIAA
jgi:hypothetical protein